MIQPSDGGPASIKVVSPAKRDSLEQSAASKLAGSSASPVIKSDRAPTSSPNPPLDRAKVAKSSRSTPNTTSDQPDRMVGEGAAVVDMKPVVPKPSTPVIPPPVAPRLAAPAMPVLDLPVAATPDLIPSPAVVPIARDAKPPTRDALVEVGQEKNVADVIAPKGQTTRGTEMDLPPPSPRPTLVLEIENQTPVTQPTLESVVPSPSRVPLTTQSMSTTSSKTAKTAKTDTVEKSTESVPATGSLVSAPIPASTTAPAPVVDAPVAVTTSPASTLIDLPAPAPAPASAPAVRAPVASTRIVPVPAPARPDPAVAPRSYADLVSSPPSPSVPATRPSRTPVTPSPSAPVRIPAPVTVSAPPTGTATQPRRERIDLASPLTVTTSPSMPEPKAEEPRDPRVMTVSADSEADQAVLPLSDNARNKFDQLIEADTGVDATMRVTVRRSRNLKTKRDVFRSVVVDPSVIDIIQFNPRELSIIGKQAGMTNLTLWFDDANGGKSMTVLVTVMPDPMADDRRLVKVKDLEKEIQWLFPDSKIKLILVGDKLIIRGQAQDQREASKIYDIVRGQYYRLDLASSSYNPRRSGADPSVEADGNSLVPPAPGLGGDSDLAAGMPGVTNMGQPGVGFPGGFGQQGMGATGSDNGNDDEGSVINLIEVPGETQVMLKVRIAELRRAALRRLGVNFNINNFGDFFVNANVGPVSGNASFAIFGDTDVRLIVDALVSNSTLKVLSEPNLVTISGRPAAFLSGGSFAVPTVVGLNGVGAASTHFQGYGTQLFFIPTILDKDRVRLQVTPSLSSINRSNTVRGIPGLNINTTFTTVEMREGQWLAISGLIYDAQSGTSARFPLLGDIPGLKTFFSDKSMDREESELIVLVSPELVRPMERKQTPTLLPGMEVTEPDDFDFFVNGRWEGRPDVHHRSTVWPIIKQRENDLRKGIPSAGPAQRSEEFYISGPKGFSHPH